MKRQTHILMKQMEVNGNEMAIFESSSVVSATQETIETKFR